MAKSKPKSTDASLDVPLVAAAAMALNPIAAKAWMDLMREGARFMADRLQRDIELQKKMLACDSPAALLELQTEFFTDAMGQYADEASRYMQMMFKLSKDIVEDAQTGHKRNYDDIPL